MGRTKNKITQEDVANMRFLYRDMTPAAVLKEKFNISSGYLSRILNDEQRKDAGGPRHRVCAMCGVSKRFNAFPGVTASAGRVCSECRGARHSLTYRAWHQMIQRCTNTNASSYRHYGGRGIFVCDCWRESFESFLLHMGDRPEGTTLDRIDVDRHYEPGNCRWVTMKVQQNNRRNNRMIEIDGKTCTAAQWADEYGIDYPVLMARLHRGWEPHDALTRPVRIVAK